MDDRMGKAEGLRRAAGATEEDRPARSRGRGERSDPSAGTGRCVHAARREVLLDDLPLGAVDEHLPLGAVDEHLPLGALGECLPPALDGPPLTAPRPGRPELLDQSLWGAERDAPA